MLESRSVSSWIARIARGAGASATVLYAVKAGGRILDWAELQRLLCVGSEGRGGGHAGQGCMQGRRLMRWLCCPFLLHGAC